MSLEIMQLKMNNIADMLDKYSQMSWEASRDFRSPEYKQSYEVASLIYENIANIIREEMKIENY